MITGELKSKIDRIWDTMWSGGVSYLDDALARNHRKLPFVANGI